jgi:hypothetical protein
MALDSPPGHRPYLSFLYLQLFVWLFSLLMPYWLVCIIHVEKRFCNTSRYNLFKHHHHSFSETSMTRTYTYVLTIATVRLDSRRYIDLHACFEV